MADDRLTEPLADAIQRIEDVLDEDEHDLNINALCACLAAEAELEEVSDDVVRERVGTWRHLLRTIAED